MSASSCVGIDVLISTHSIRQRIEVNASEHEKLPEVIQPRIVLHMTTLGDRLDELMQADPSLRGRGAQTRLSEKTGIPQGTISRILKNKTEPETANVQKLADHFGVTIDWLLNETEPKYAAKAVVSSSLGAITGSANVVQAPNVAHAVGAVETIRQVIDGQHKMAAISDDDATLLRAALHAVQSEMNPTLRAAILLMLGAQTQVERPKDGSVHRIGADNPVSNSVPGEPADDAAAFAKRTRADVRSAAEHEGSEQHGPGKHGT